VSKLEEQLEAANDDSPEARARQREFEELLKNLALSGETRKRGTGQGGARRVEQVEARRRPVPSELRQRFDAFTRGLSQSGAGAKPATGANANPAAKPPGSQPKSTTPAPRK